VRDAPWKIRVATVEFKSDALIPAPAEARLTRYIIRRAIYDSPDWVEDLEARVKDAWQHQGYFFPDIKTSVRALGQNQVEHNFALTFHVTAGRKYKLGEIKISGAKVFPSNVLLDCFDLKAGDIFDVHRVRNGLDCVRSGYDAFGYMNLEAVPDTRIDDSHGQISFLLKIHEGPQFRVGKITILGGRKDSIEKLIQESGFRTGAIFSSRLIEDFIQKNRNMFPGGVDQEADVERQVDESTNTVDLLFNLKDEV
jgi:outer membrane protein assembly factor BamA